MRFIRKQKDLEQEIPSFELSEKISYLTENFQLGISGQVLDTFHESDLSDPVAKQYLPDDRELEFQNYELTDPIGDGEHSPVKGVVHRYPDRVLLTPSHLCAVYCRFCFRREKVGQADEQLSKSELDLALDYIRNQQEIFEVILTGGDPLALPADKLGKILKEIDAIEHVGAIRIHSRVPVAWPQRLDEAYLQALKISKPVNIVIHTNHANELNESFADLVKNLRNLGIGLFSQSVLLRGVNDDFNSLDSLFRKLFSLGVKPYYLHHLDLAKGTSHFRVPLSEGLDLYRQVRKKLSGLAMPQYVIDIPGGYGKVGVDSARVRHLGEEKWQLEDSSGRLHLYEIDSFVFAEKVDLD